MTVCLALIARNEEAVIARAIRSCSGPIDSIVLVDTGSGDDTIELAKDAAAEIQVRIYVYHRQWVSFGHNRTELVRLAATKAEYLLLLDADMTVEGTLDDLIADQYMVRIAGDLEYRLPLLVRSGVPWRYEGVTHEYLTADQQFSQEHIDSFVVHHHCDGSRRPEKIEADAQLLKAELDRDPGNPRTVFYLAQTYRDLGQNAAAIALYRRRMWMGGFEEEAFYAEYQAALLAEDVAGLLLAWQRRPTRLEPLYDAARLLRETGHPDDARLLARRGLGQPLPDDVLFVTPWVWTDGIPQEAEGAAALAASG